jgi:hypothetical protein
MMLFLNNENNIQKNTVVFRINITFVQIFNTIQNEKF